MAIRNLLSAAAGLAMMAGAAPAFADTQSVPPGDPCAKNNGNPCNGNNGNLGEQGNAIHEKTRIDKKPPPIILEMPPVSGRGAFVSQIGQENIASVHQTAPNAYARIDQDGSRNEVDASQTGTGSAYAHASQTGTGNFARLQQDGSGQNVAYLTQSGTSNWAWVKQSAEGALHNGAQLVQKGSNNDMLLHQEGSGNLAVLSQDGDGNGMTAVQLGEGNQLTWTQQGTNLTDLQITQAGGDTKGGQLMITQTTMYPGN